MGFDTQVVLRCGQCNKPFDKESTLKRHGYYCRTRKAGRKAVPRARSCVTCVKRKARCDNGRPECSYCVQKGIECCYLTGATKVASNETHEKQPKLQESSPTLLDGTSHHELDPDVFDYVDLSLVKGLDAGLTKASGPIFNWNDLDVTFDQFINEQVVEQPWTSHPILSQQLPIPTAPRRNIRSIIARPRADSRSQRTMKLIMHTLKSYLRMMQQDHTLPPFIHPGLASSSFGTSRMEPMATCMSLMHMLSSEVQGSRRLFWRNVRLECERLISEYTAMTRLELLAALQALSIYIFVRLDEGQTDDNNFDAMMLAAVTVISQQFNCNWCTPEQYKEEQSELQVLWHEWVVKESVNRLCLVYRIMDMLAYFEPASMCDLPSDLLLAPLPARKQLWEAPDEFAWNLESSKDLMGEAVFGLAASGDLVKFMGFEPSISKSIAHCAAYSGERDAANWEEWCSGMDSLGGLVMLAASLVG